LKPYKKIRNNALGINSLKPSPLVGEGRVRGDNTGVNHPHPYLLPSREKEMYPSIGFYFWRLGV
jgi:hypothetical protein